MLAAWLADSSKNPILPQSHESAGVLVAIVLIALASVAVFTLLYSAVRLAIRHERARSRHESVRGLDR